MAKTYDQRALDNAKPQEYYDSYERIYGWKCFYCKTLTKEDKCPNCQKDKESARM